MSLLSKNAILGASDLASEVLSVPQWGGDVRIRELTAHERSVFEKDAMAGKEIDWVDYKVRMVCICVVDEANERIFSDEDRDAVGKRSPAAIDLVFNAITALNKLGNAATDEAEKASAVTQADGSTSNSPGDLDTPTPT